jgi:hypothetical protein
MYFQWQISTSKQFCASFYDVCYKIQPRNGSTDRQVKVIACFLITGKFIKGYSKIFFYIMKITLFKVCQWRIHLRRNENAGKKT